MSVSSKSPEALLDSQGHTTMGNEEARMRQALGLGHSQGGTQNGRPPQRRDQDRQGRRFVRDGEVPVVVLHTKEHDAGAIPVNRVAAAENAFRAERTARENTERSLREVQAHLQGLQTKLAHSELAHGEALAAERTAREAAEAALGEVRAERDSLQARIAELTAELAIQRTSLPVEPSPPVATAAPLRAKPGPKPKLKPGPKPAKAARAAAPAREPKPVKWWLPSFKAKAKARAS